MAKIQPCRCGHAKTIHTPKRVQKKLQSACRFPGCKCKRYKPKD